MLHCNLRASCFSHLVSVRASPFLSSSSPQLTSQMGPLWVLAQRQLSEQRPLPVWSEPGQEQLQPELACPPAAQLQLNLSYMQIQGVWCTSILSSGSCSFAPSCNYFEFCSHSQTKLAYACVSMHTHASQCSPGGPARCHSGDTTSFQPPQHAPQTAPEWVHTSVHIITKSETHTDV